MASNESADTMTSPVIMKFGGSSLATAEAIQRVSGIIRDEKRPKVVVLSAIGKTTNALIAARDNALKGDVDIGPTRKLHEDIASFFNLPLDQEVEELLEELNRALTGVAMLRGATDGEKIRDLITSFGERMCVRLFSSIYNHLYKEENPAKPMDSWDAGFITNDVAARSGASKDVLLPTCMENIKSTLNQKLNENVTPIVTGFIAKDSDGYVTTLGRDGSDLSASIIGAALKADRVEIWKDVDGILTTDPRLCENAKPVTVITFEEAQELSYFGAKCVHPQAILPVIEHSITMVVKNSCHPELPGTKIVPTAEAQGVRAISCKRQVTMIDIVSTRMLGQHGFLKKTFSLFDEYSISVDTIATSEVSISLTLDQSFDKKKLIQLIEKLEEFADVHVRGEMALIAIIAPRHKSNKVLLRSFEIFEQNGIEVEMLSHGASKVNVSFLVQDQCLLNAVQKLHDAFFTPGETGIDGA